MNVYASAHDLAAAIKASNEYIDFLFPQEIRNPARMPMKRTEGHARGEAALLDVIHGALEIGIPYLSAYAFSTENWKRSPEEVRWLMGFNRKVIHRRRDELDAMGVRIRWAG